MATQYPTTYPCPSISSFSALVSMGVARSDMGGNQVQRRVFSTMPHTFSLTFTMSVTAWTAWQRWVKDNAYGWFEMSLPSLYAGKAGSLLTPTLIRFTSPISASNVTESQVQLSVQAEMAPSMIAKYLETI